MNLRQSRLASSIQICASEAVLEFSKQYDHSHGIISVIEVSLTSDSSLAVITISAEMNEDKLLKFLNPLLPKIRKRISGEHSLRITPEIRFRLRKKGEKNTDILSLIHQLDKQYGLSQESHT